MKTHLLLSALILLGTLGCKTLKTPTRAEVVEESFLNIKQSQTAGDKAVLTGQISDAKSKESITFAKVVLSDAKNQRLGVMSNEEGKFELTHIPAGDYYLTIEAIEFRTISQPIRLKGGIKYTLDVGLIERIDQIEKPVIYLYPSHKQAVHVQLNYAGNLTHTYPQYPENGWRVTAEPNGTLWDEKGMEYYALFWEGVPNKPLAANDGFVVAGKETAKFLEEKLAYLGLNRREANEFIMYWLPRMENNNYNLIHFSGKDYEDIAELKISPQPETLIRVMMLTQPLPSKMDFPKQDLSPLHKTRKGFTVVEWGGAEVELIQGNRLP